MTGRVQSVNVTFSDACTDVLVYLRSVAYRGRTREEITSAVAPPWSVGAEATVTHSIGTLREVGLVVGSYPDPGEKVRWSITHAGVEAVDAAREATDV